MAWPQVVAEVDRFELCFGGRNACYIGFGEWGKRKESRMIPGFQVRTSRFSKIDKCFWPWLLSNYFLCAGTLSNPQPGQRECGILTTGLPGKSRDQLNLNKQKTLQITSSAITPQMSSVNHSVNVLWAFFSYVFLCVWYLQSKLASKYTCPFPA